jgi:YVTN family beta-propeller protein
MRLRNCVAACCMLLVCAAPITAGAQAFWTEAAQQWLEAADGGGLVSWLQQTPRVDFDEDGVVGFSDFLLFVRSYSAATGDDRFDSRMDLNADGAIDFADFLSFGSAYNGQFEPDPVASGFRIYVADYGEGALTVLDTNSHLITEHLTFRGPSSVRASSDGQTLYVSEGFGLFAMDTEHRAVFSVPTDSYGRIEMSPDERFIYLTQEQTDQLIVIDVAGQEIVDTVGVGDTPVDLEITPDGRRLYVANSDSRDVTVVDVPTMAAVGRIDLGSRPSQIGITPDGLTAYVTDLDRGVISVIDLRTNLVAGGIPVDGAFARGLTFSPDGKTLYVTSERMLVAVDVGRNLVARTLELGDDTSAIAITPDGSRIYAGTLLFGKGGPGLSVMDVATWRVLGRIRGFLFPAEIEFVPMSVAGSAQ